MMSKLSLLSTNKSSSNANSETYKYKFFFKMKINLRNNCPQHFFWLCLIFLVFCNYKIANASSYVFHCKPWIDQILKISKEDNFSIKVNNESLTILGGDQTSKFANLIFTHPHFYLFASPAGSIINISRSDGSKKVT